MSPRQHALAKFHGAVVLSLLAVMAVYFAVIWFVWGEVVAFVLDTYGVDDIWAVLAMGILFLLVVELFVQVFLAIPRRVARYMAKREGLTYVRARE